MEIWGGDDVLVGPGPDADKAEAEAARKATLLQMGIKPLVAFSSEMMDAPVPEPRKDAALAGWANRPTPRKDAQAAGEKYYVSGKPCPANHKSRRYTSTGQCVACLHLVGEALAAGKHRAKVNA